MIDYLPSCVQSIITGYNPFISNALVSLLREDLFFNYDEMTLTFDIKHDDFLLLGKSQATLMTWFDVISHLQASSNDFWCFLLNNLKIFLNEQSYKFNPKKYVVNQKLFICDHFCEDEHCPWHELLEAIFGITSSTANNIMNIVL